VLIVVLSLSVINIFPIALADSNIKMSTPSPSLDPDDAELLWNYTANDGIRDVAISADGGLVAASTYSQDSSVHLFNDTASESKIPLWSYNATNNVYAVDITSGGNHIVAVSDEQNVMYFNDSVTSPKMPEWEFTPTSDYPNDVAISANGNYIVAATDDGTVHLINNTYGNPKTEMWNFSTGSGIWSVSISADGKYIAVGSNDNYLYL
jgi:WD40 repeat protein